MEQKSEKEVKTIAGFLASALDIEDDMSSRFYGEYIERSKWPADLTEEAFLKIKVLLEELISETENHKRVFLKLAEEIK